MGKDPSDIRAQIEETRARVGDEVDALSYKTDVPARVGDYVDEKKQAVKDKVTGFKEAVTGTASSAVDSVAGTAASAVPNRQQVGRVKDTAERNPLGLAVGAASLGFVAGMLIPSTRVENEHMGEVSDRVIDTAKETATDALERGKLVAHDAVEAVKESSQEQGQELASNLQERAQETFAGPQSSSPSL